MAAFQQKVDKSPFFNDFFSVAVQNSFSLQSTNMEFNSQTPVMRG